MASILSSWVVMRTGAQVIRVALVHPAPEPPNPLCLGPHLVPGPDLQQGSNWEKKRKKLE